VAPYCVCRWYHRLNAVFSWRRFVLGGGRIAFCLRVWACRRHVLAEPRLRVRAASAVAAGRVAIMALADVAAAAPTATLAAIPSESGCTSGAAASPARRAYSTRRSELPVRRVRRCRPYAPRIRVLPCRRRVYD